MRLTDPYPHECFLQQNLHASWKATAAIYFLVLLWNYTSKLLPTHRRWATCELAPQGGPSSLSEMSKRISLTKSPRWRASGGWCTIRCVTYSTEPKGMPLELITWSFSAKECGSPGSWGSCETLSLSILFGRFFLLEISPAAESVRASKSFPSDTPMNSVKEWSSRTFVVCSTVTSLGQNSRVAWPFLLEQASCSEHEPVLQDILEFFSGILWDDGLPLAKALFSLSGTIMILSFTKPFSSSVNSLFEGGLRSCPSDSPECSLESVSFVGRASWSELSLEGTTRSERVALEALWEK